MIGRLKGIVEERGAETCLLDVSGVVYELTCSNQTLDDLVVGERATLQVYTHIREDLLALFGFGTVLEKELFLSLLSVNGVGPKMAIKILSAASVYHIARAVESGDVKALSQLPKVGKKTAEQMIISLKGKLEVFLAAQAGGTAGGLSGVGAGAAPLPLHAQALSARDVLYQDIGSALQNLGFRTQEVEKILEQLAAREIPEAELTLESGVRYALQALGGMR
jgi:Holliday junction DNA helicase RuvA